MADHAPGEPFTLPAEGHWCGACEYGMDYDREDYPVICLECRGRGWWPCHDMDCEQHTPESPVHGKDQT